MLERVSAAVVLGVFAIGSTSDNSWSASRAEARPSSITSEAATRQPKNVPSPTTCGASASALAVATLEVSDAIGGIPTVVLSIASSTPAVGLWSVEVVSVDGSYLLLPDLPETLTELSAGSNLFPITIPTFEDGFYVVRARIATDHGEAGSYVAEPELHLEVDGDAVVVIDVAEWLERAGAATVELGEVSL